MMGESRGRGSGGSGEPRQGVLQGLVPRGEPQLTEGTTKNYKTLRGLKVWGQVWERVPQRSAPELRALVLHQHRSRWLFPRGPPALNTSPQARDGLAAPLWHKKQLQALRDCVWKQQVMEAPHLGGAKV